MAESLAQVGQLQPIVARVPGPPYEIVVGHCRSLAAHRLGWVTLETKLVEASDDECFWGRAHENGKRIPLSPAERVKEATEAVGRCRGDVDAAAFRLGYTRSTVEDWFEVGGWPDDVREVLFRQELSRAACSWLARVTTDQERGYMLRQAVEHQYSERITRHWYNDWRVSGMARPEGAQAPGPATPATPMPDPVAPCVFCGQLSSFADMTYWWGHGECQALFLQHRGAIEVLLFGEGGLAIRHPAEASTTEVKQGDDHTQFGLPVRE